MQEKLEKLIREIANLKSRFDQHEKRLNALEGFSDQPFIEPAPYETPEKEVFSEPMTKTSSNETAPIDWRAIEMTIGNYFLQIIGVAVFVFGMGFLLKYSIEKGLISPLVRIAISFMSATALLIFSEFLIKKYKQWALGCVAGSVVIYYLSFYAAHKLYTLISLPTAYAGCIAASILTIILALRHSSRTIATFSVIGGFITPLLLFNPLQSNLSMTFFGASYLFILALGFLVISYLKNWFFLSFLSFIGILINCSSSTANNFPLNSFLLFMTILWIMYSVLPYLYALITKTTTMFEVFILPFSTASIFTLIAAKLTNANHYYVKDDLGNFILSSIAFNETPSFIKALFMNATNTQIFNYLSFAFGGIYLIGLVTLFIRNKENIYLLGSLFTITIGFFALTILTQWTGLFLVDALFIYGLALFILSIIVQKIFVRIFAYFSWVMATIIFLVEAFVPQKTYPSLIFNSLNASFALIFLIFVLSAFLCYRYKMPLKKSLLIYQVFLPVVP